MRRAKHVGRRRRFVSGLIFVVLAGAMSLFLLDQDDVNELVAPPAVKGTPAPIAVILTEEERSYYEYVGGRIRALTAEAAALAKLGDDRSRNLVELQIRSDRVTLLADQIDAFVSTTPLPARFSTAMQSYSLGAADMRAGMDAATSAFLRFDWDAVAKGLDQFKSGAAQIDSSYLQLRAIVSGGSTPVAVQSSSNAIAHRAGAIVLA